MLSVGDTVRVIDVNDPMLGKEGEVIYVPSAVIASPAAAYVRLVSVTHAGGAPAGYVARWYAEAGLQMLSQRRPLANDLVPAVGGPCGDGKLSASLSPLHVGPQLSPAGDGEISGTYHLTQVNEAGKPPARVMVWHED